MMYILMIFIGISIGLIISKLFELKKVKSDKEFFELIDKVVLVEKTKKPEKKTNSNKI